MTPDAHDLHDLVAQKALAPVASEIAAAASHVAALHAPHVEAVIAYGSVLRGEKAADTLIDLYVLTDALSGVSSNPLARLGCRLVPPNVAYAETSHGGVRLRVKYALLPLDLFCLKVGPQTANPYFWARFAQPCRLVHAVDPEVRERVISALATAVTTFVSASRPLAAENSGDIAELWRRGFAMTYRTELRAERETRADRIVAGDPAWYEAAGHAALAGMGAEQSPKESQRGWSSRRRRGKALSVLRLVKAAFTFSAGADYLAWKVSRHAGIEVRLKPWQRRHPIVAALVLLPALLRKGAVH